MRNLLIGRTVHSVGKNMTGYAVPSCGTGRGWYSTAGTAATAKRVTAELTCESCIDEWLAAGSGERFAATITFPR